jgi:hypothetical protein
LLFSLTVQTRLIAGGIKMALLRDDLRGFLLNESLELTFRDPKNLSFPGQRDGFCCESAGLNQFVDACPMEREPFTCFSNGQQRICHDGFVL